MLPAGMTTMTRRMETIMGMKKTKKRETMIMMMKVKMAIKKINESSDKVELYHSCFHLPIEFIIFTIMG